MSRLHIAYRVFDQDKALELKKELERLKHSVSIDVDFLVAGIEWRRQLDEAFAVADFLVVLLSKNSIDEKGVINSQWISADIGAARFSKKIVLPVLLDGITFPELIDDIFGIRPESNSMAIAAAELSKAIEVHEQANRANAGIHLPNGYEHLASAVRQFREDHAYETSVFVMMKFPDPGTMKEEQSKMLDRIYEITELVLNAHGLKARRADKKSYRDDLWENLCVYMFGCKFGLAILEDRGANEMNPNVALEYGFMKAMNRQMGLLRENSFQHDRADLTGKLARSFTIRNEFMLDDDSLKNGLKHWLIDSGVPAREQS
jgi:hypothetical protein